MLPFLVYNRLMETQDLTLAEAARAVGLHVETMRRLAREGQIETYRVNPGARSPRFRVTPAALQAFRERGKRSPAPEQTLKKSEIPEVIEYTEDGPPFIKGIIPGTLSGAEMIALWEENGVFDVWEERKAQIGPGKRFADSAEYARHLREQAQRRARE